MIKTNSKRWNVMTFLSLSIIMLAGQSCKKNDLVQEGNPGSEQLLQLKSFVASSTGLSPSQVEYNVAGKYFSAGKDGRISLADAQLRMENEPVSTSEVTAKQRLYCIQLHHPMYLPLPFMQTIRFRQTGSQLWINPLQTGTTLIVLFS